MKNSDITTKKEKGEISMVFHKDVLQIDCQEEINRITDFIRQQTLAMRREGIVVGISGGVDSALIASLCVEALGKDKVFGLILPEKESNPVSSEYARKMAEKLDIRTETVDITSVLSGLGTYSRRNTDIKKILPDYQDHFKIKITLPPDLLDRDAFNFFSLIVDDGSGNIRSIRLNKDVLNGIVAATNTKQRTRMIYLYYFAEKKNYLVCGTTNRSEALQGFFVKFGDGGVDIEPIAHLYKTQVFELAAYMGVIREIRERMPSPDTYTFEVTDEEFYFRMPFDKLDMLLYAWEYKIPVGETAQVMDLQGDQVSRAFRDFSSKFKASMNVRELPLSLL